MSNEDATHEAPTRREYVKYGGAVAVGGMLAGCAGQSDSGSGDTPEQTETETDSSYEVCMDPMGCVEFEEPPERIFALFWPSVDMCLALNRGDNILGSRQQAFDFYNQDEMTNVYERFGISFNLEGVESVELGTDKEIFYELDPDVIFFDPLVARYHPNFGWDEDDFNEIQKNIAPFFGSNASYTAAGYEYIADNVSNFPVTEDFEPLSLWEVFGKVAEVLQETERYELLKRIHSEFIADIQKGVPDDRAEVAYLNLSPEEETFWSVDPNQPGYIVQQFHDLGGVDNALSRLSDAGRFGWEALLDVDPETILVVSGIVNSDHVSYIRDHKFGSELTAVQENRLYEGAMANQGPLLNLVNTEMTAKQLYPGEFGEWRGLGNTPEDERLFDRQHVADIISGNI